MLLKFSNNNIENDAYLPVDKLFHILEIWRGNVASWIAPLEGTRWRLSK
jgi:hypothetical protein